MTAVSLATCPHPEVASRQVGSWHVCPDCDELVCLDDLRTYTLAEHNALVKTASDAAWGRGHMQGWNAAEQVDDDGYSPGRYDQLKRDQATIAVVLFLLGATA